MNFRCFTLGHLWTYVESSYRICSRCRRHHIRLNFAPGKNRWTRVS